MEVPMDGELQLSSNPREVARIRPDGSYTMEHDITPREALDVLPIVLQYAARLLMEKMSN